MKKILIFGLLALLGLQGQQITARMVTPSSVKKFDKYLEKYELVMAYFYRLDKEIKKDKRLRGKLDDLADVFKAASKSEPYVTFMKVNLGKEKLAELADEFYIDQVPAFILFRNGAEHKVDGKSVRLYGFVGKAQMLDHIEKYFDEYIEEIIEEEERELERERVRAYYWGPRWYWYHHPYGYYDYWYPYRYGFYWGVHHHGH